MNKFLRPLIVIALLIGLLPIGALSTGTALAAPADALSTLAAFFPADTPFFAAARIDDGHIETLNGLLNALAAHLPAGTLLPDSLWNNLDAAVQLHFPEGSFTDTVSPWLGDFGAVGITTFAPLVDDDLDNDSELPSAVIAQITDRAGAEAFFEPIMAPNVEAGYFELRKTADFTLYESPDPAIPLQLMITDDLLILALAGLDPVVTPRITNLDSNATFQQALTALPAEEYNVAIYLSGEEIKKLLNGQEDELPATLQLSIGSLDEWAGLAIGLTILDGTVLTIDTAMVPSTDTPAAVTGMLDGSAIDPAFDAFLAGGAQFVARSANLRDGLASLVDFARAVEPGAEADLEEVATTIRAGVQQVFGLDVDEDIVSWLSGDYAVTFSLDPALMEALINAGGGETPQLERFPLDLGLVVAAVDPAKAQALVAALSDTLPALLAQDENTDATLTLETIGDSSTIVISVPVESGDITMPPLEILIGASEDVFALGTRSIVTAALAPGDGIPSQTAYMRARSYALPGAVSFGYISQAGVQGLGELVIGSVVLGPEIGTTFESIEGGMIATLTPDQQAEQARQMEQARQQAIESAQLVQTQVQAVISLIESVATSAAPGEDGTYLQRITLTLTSTP